MTKFESFKMDRTDIQRFLVSTIGALAVSATCIGAAVGPVKAAELRAPLVAAAPAAAQNFQLAAK